MGILGDEVRKIRSKNAGAFWLTIDIFCFDAENFSEMRCKIRTSDVALLFQTDESCLRRFDIEDLCVIKFSLPRPEVQGTVHDRDMHGASYAVLLEEFEL